MCIWKPVPAAGTSSGGSGFHTNVPATSGRSLQLFFPRFFVPLLPAGGHSCAVVLAPRWIHFEISLIVPFDSGSPDSGMRLPGAVPRSFWTRKLPFGSPGLTSIVPGAAPSDSVTGRFTRLA